MSWDQDLLKSKNELETDLSVIQSDLSEEAEPEGVFLCEYGVFRQIYRLEVRRSARLGLSEYVLLLTVTPKAYVSQNSDTYLKVINDAMEQLKGVLNGSLRIGDVASRYSGSQYVVMLPTCTFESAEMVGMSITWAAVLGAAARLRPILMTSLAMVVGLLPMMFAFGVGAHGNRTLGTAAIGGMFIGMIFQIFIVPVLFVVFQYLQEKFKPIEWEDLDNSDMSTEIEQYAKIK